MRKNSLKDNKNILCNFSKNSNTEIFKNANKIVTFSGTSQYEAAANGIKPIIISSSPLHKFDSTIVHKPKTINHYEKLLLSKDIDIFRNPNNKILLTRNIIFFREKILRMKDMIGGIDVYRSDSSKIIKKQYIQIQKNIHKHYDYLLETGKKLIDNNTTYSNFINKYFKDIKKSEKKNR